MILKKLLLVLVAFLMVGSVAKAADKTKQVYVYGMAISFNDSTVYMTDIQTLDSAAVRSKTGFLYGRDNYSYQLRDYLKSKGFQTPTCETTFSVKKKDIEKKFIAAKKRYGNGKYTLKHITPNEFQYTVITLDVDDEKPMTKEERKAMKVQAKEAKAKTKAEAKAKAEERKTLKKELKDKKKGPKPEGQRPE